MHEPSVTASPTIGCATSLRIRGATDDDHQTIVALLNTSWGSTSVVVHNTVFDASLLPALLAELDGRIVGLLTYDLAEEGLEVVTLDAFERHIGVGSTLLSAVAQIAREARIRRVWLVTTNDNLDALRFYQRRGMRITAVLSGGVDIARRAKPSIPLVGDYNIEIHDELVLEMNS